MQTLSATVVSTKMNKTIGVEIGRQVRHPLYHKLIKRTTKLLVHCENENIKVGDVITIKKTKPFSRNVHFEVITEKPVIKKITKKKKA